MFSIILFFWQTRKKVSDFVSSSVRLCWRIVYRTLYVLNDWIDFKFCYFSICVVVVVFLRHFSTLLATRKVLLFDSFPVIMLPVKINWTRFSTLNSFLLFSFPFFSSSFLQFSCCFFYFACCWFVFVVVSIQYDRFLLVFTSSTKLNVFLPSSEYPTNAFDTHCA